MITYRVLPTPAANASNKMATTYIVCSDELSLDTIDPLITAYLADPLVPRPHRILVDLSETRCIDLSYREAEALVRRMMRETRNDPTSPRFAFVTPSPMSYGMGRLFQLLAPPITGFEISLHRTVAEAATALDQHAQNIAAA